MKCEHNLPIGDSASYTIAEPSVLYNSDWFEVSVVVKYKKPIKPKYHHSNADIHHDPIGIDLGIVHLAVASTGEQFNNPNTKKLDQKIARAQRKLARRYEYSKRVSADLPQTCDMKTKYPELVYKSQNLLKAESEIRKLYRKHANIRKNARCQAISKIVSHYPKYIVIEDINNPRKQWGIKGANKYNKRINDTAIGDFIQRLKCKYNWLDIPIISADKCYPSTKRCNRCGNISDNKLTRDRMFKCCKCGYEEDRDLNAAYNLRDYNVDNWATLNDVIYA